MKTKPVISKPEVVTKPPEPPKRDTTVDGLVRAVLERDAAANRADVLACVTAYVADRDGAGSTEGGYEAEVACVMARWNGRAR